MSTAPKKEKTMGSAAYRRGSRAIARQLDAEQRPAAFTLMDELNALPKYPDAGRPLGPVQFVYSHNAWWIECPTTGFGYCYPSLREAVARWHITLISYAHGIWGAIPSSMPSA
jgi:hypothetical protein